MWHHFSRLQPDATEFRAELLVLGTVFLVFCKVFEATCGPTVVTDDQTLHTDLQMFIQLPFAQEQFLAFFVGALQWQTDALGGKVDLDLADHALPRTVGIMQTSDMDRASLVRPDAF